MARGPKYRVFFRRRREAKTDYYLRQRLLLSRLPRFVIRRSLKHSIAQIVNARIEGDFVITSGHTNELMRDFGWLGGCGNMPASYLVGFLTGYRGLEFNVSKAILDIGTFSPIGGSRLFATLKGAIDAGLNIPHNEKILPDESRIRGEHIADYANLLFETDSEKYETHFSKYLERGLDPRGLPEHLDAIKHKISEKYEGG